MRNLLFTVSLVACAAAALCLIGSGVCLGKACLLHSFSIGDAIGDVTPDSLSDAEFLNAGMLVIEAQSQAAFFMAFSTYLLLATTLLGVAAAYSFVKYRKMPKPQPREEGGELEDDFDAVAYEERYTRRRRHLLDRGGHPR